MANRRTLIVFVSALAMAGALMAGCDRPQDNSSGSSGGGQFPPDNAAAQVTSPAPGSAGCAQVGTLTGAELPTLDSEFKIVADNPCLPSTELLDRVTSLIPQEERGAAGRAYKLVDNLDGFVNRLGQISAVAQCAYKTDRLAIRVYGSTKNSWAYGVAAVVRGRLGAVADTTACYLLGQIAGLGLGVQSVNGDDSPGFCYETNSDKRGDQDYTIMWISDSSHMCEALRGSLVPGDGAIVAVHADPDVALRSGPTTDDAVIRSLPNQTMGHAQCKTTGESVADGDDVWIKTEALGSTGYIAQSYLEGNTLRAGDDLPNC